MMITDEQYGALPSPPLRGMRRQIEIASKSGTEFLVQVAEHHKKSYYTIETFEAESTARNGYRRTTCKPRGRRRLVKVCNGVLTVMLEHLGELL